MHAEALLFMHIPKTAGISVSLALTEKFEARQLYHVRSQAQDQAPKFSPHHGPEVTFRELPLKQRSAFRCVLGHFHFGLHEAIPGKSQYFTLLRNPLERYVSQVAQYNRMAAAGELGPEARPVTLQEYRHVRPAQFKNPQTRWIAGLTDGQMSSLAPESALAIAQRNLREHFCVVGTVERLAESLELLARVRGWKSLAVGRENASKVRPSFDEFTPAQRAEFEAANQLDKQLWLQAGAELGALLEAVPRTPHHSAKVFSFQRIAQTLSRRRAA